LFGPFNSHFWLLKIFLAVGRRNTKDRSQAITTVRGLIEYLLQEKEILVTEKEIDPICESAGISKAFEDGPAALFENVKGYPGHRYPKYPRWSGRTSKITHYF